MRSHTARGAALILLGVILGFLGVVEVAAGGSTRGLVDVALAAVALVVGGWFVARDRARR